MCRLKLMVPPLVTQEVLLSNTSQHSSTVLSEVEAFTLLTRHYHYIVNTAHMTELIQGVRWVCIAFSKLPKEGAFAAFEHLATVHRILSTLSVLFQKYDFFIFML